MASLRRKPNSKFWFACFTLPDGTRTQRSTKTTDRRIAQKLADEFEAASRMPLTESQARRVIGDIHKMLSGRALESPRVSDYFSQWIGARKGTVAPSTLKEYEATLSDFVEFLGERARADLAFVSTADVATFRDKTGAKLSPSSANKKLKIIRVALQQAWRDGFIEENPAAKVQLLKPSTDAVERRAFELEELKSILKVSTGEWTGLILFGLYTGQRLGDIARLKWELFDLNRGVLSFNTRKTGRRQIIPLARPLLGWVQEWRQRSGGTAKGDLFPASAATVGKSENVGGLSNQFSKLMAAAGLVEKRSHQKKEEGKGRAARREVSELSFHSLRHTATSLMKNAGISPAIVQEFVGHDSKVVSQNYTHIETEALRKAADALPDLINLPPST